MPRKRISRTSVALEASTLYYRERPTQRMEPRDVRRHTCRICLRRHLRTLQPTVHRCLFSCVLPSPQDLKAIDFLCNETDYVHRVIPLLLYFILRALSELLLRAITILTNGHLLSNDYDFSQCSVVYQTFVHSSVRAFSFMSKASL